jgi:hypothetical protein
MPPARRSGFRSIEPRRWETQSEGFWPPPKRPPWSARRRAAPTLLALRAAKVLGLRRRLVLPFSVEAFRDTSVTDRPDDWGPLYDELIAAARQTDDLVVMDG